MRVRAPPIVPCLLALGLAACAPGQVERVEFLDAGGMLRRVDLPKAATGAEVQARLGRPDMIRPGPGQTEYWLYSYDHVRFNYVLTFRGDRLAHVRYMARPGAIP